MPINYNQVAGDRLLKRPAGYKYPNPQNPDEEEDPLKLKPVAMPVDLYIQYLKDPTLIFIMARMVSVLSGCGVVWLSYLIALKSYNKREDLFVNFLALLQ